MPPQPSGIADYSFDVLGELAGHLEVVAVVDDEVARHVRTPPGVTVAGASTYASGAAGRCALDVYQMGNHPFLHAYMHGPALDRPGVLVLHDPALLDASIRLLGGAEDPLFLSEARYEDPGVDGTLPTIVVDGRPELDRLSLLMTRRLVESSLVTLVHSSWARDTLAARHRCSRVSLLPVPARLRPASPPKGVRRTGDPVFGVFGGLAPNKRLRSVLRAFAEVHRSCPRARLVIAGRRDYPAVHREVGELVVALSIEEAVRILVDVPGEVLDEEIDRCDVVVALRWPSAGETSGIVVRAFGAGKPVIVSDLPQYRDLDRAFCWAVPTDEEGERGALTALMRSAAEDPESCRAAGRSARAFAAAVASFARVRDRYLEVIGEAVRSRAALDDKRSAGRRPGGGFSGVNVRRRAWRRRDGARWERSSAGGCPVSVVNVAVHGVPREENRRPSWLFELPQGRRHPFDLWYLNVNEMGAIAEHDLRPARSDRYVIGSWFWELPRVSAAFRSQIDRLDEIWAGSRFVADTFRGHTAKPVQVMPCVIEPAPRQDLLRGDFGLPEDACIFLFSFDANSSMARKNPFGVVRAFHQAFAPREGRGPARLAVKTVNLGRHREVRGRLAEAVERVGGVLIEDDVERSEMDALIGLCDVYVSLHRSEGFGFGMAEAMHLGRPVIATAYSGNMDFMSAANSCLVGYRLRPISLDDHEHDPAQATVYEAGQLWAEPDLRQAGRWMRRLYERPAERARIGAAGAETVRRRYSSAAAQTAMVARLEEVARERAR